MQNGDGARADFGADGAHQRRDTLRRIAVGVDGNRRASRVVTVEAAAGVDVELGPLPRTQRHAPFGADEARPRDAAVERIDIVHAEPRDVTPQADHGPQPRGPFDSFCAYAPAIISSTES